MDREDHDNMILKTINPVAHKGELTRLWNIFQKKQSEEAE